MTRVFVLEDDPQRIVAFQDAALAAGVDLTLAKDAFSAMTAFDGPYDCLFLDHDLGGEVHVPSDAPNTGAAFCRHLMRSTARDRVIVHSYNQAGAMEMIRTLREKGYSAVWSPFGPSVLAHLASLGGAEETQG